MRTVEISDLSFCEQYHSDRVQGGRLSVHIPPVKVVADTATAYAVEVAGVVTPAGAAGASAGAAAGAAAGGASVGGTPVLSVRATAFVGVV
ncbi:hypothetical protein [Leptolyngbya sp. NIES-2104]|uniref:hypothetical protein n=1 Tax=Leptolyngbya sp. NIES-2104 TaxID=1552121 RepID=UPI0006EC4688|nr:hypothetical protein [Leptolyngbya sp. NIES-2104]GAP99360.1 hypothetical protein NIES2104_59210 [Leptolyngbya sp. NIES-2104]